MRGPIWLVVVWMALPATATAAAAAADYKAPRTASGAPDLEGLWTNLSMTTLERGSQTPAVVLSEAQAGVIEARRRAGAARRLAPVDPRAGLLPETDGDVGQQQTEQGDPVTGFARIRGQVRTAWIVSPADGHLPYRPEVAARRKAANGEGSADGPEARPPTERCLMGMGWPMGPPLLNSGYNANYQIVQTPKAVAIISEMNHDARIIPLGGAPLPAAIRPWMGDSLGHWERDTLVIETRRLNPTQAARGRVTFSPDARITERFTRVARDQILYEFSVDDPATYTEVWRGEMVLNRTPGPMYEVACHEGNYSLPNILAGARAGEREGKTRAGRP